MLGITQKTLLRRTLSILAFPYGTILFAIILAPFGSITIALFFIALIPCFISYAFFIEVSRHVGSYNPTCPKDNCFLFTCRSSCVRPTHMGSRDKEGRSPKSCQGKRRARSSMGRSEWSSKRTHQ